MTIEIFFTKSLNLIIKRPYFLLRRIYIFFKTTANKSGSKKECNICGKTLNNFLPYRSHIKTDKYTEMLDYVGSDILNFSCVHCYCNDRERHLFMYFDKLGLWKEFSDKKILHFAPEYSLSKKIKTKKPSKYIRCDYYPDYLYEGDNDVLKVDATNIQFNDNSFDIILCNHVLEHITDYKKAISEIYRVLNFNGIAILQTPYSKTLKKNFEDPGIKSESQREVFYGQFDHVRVFSEKQFLNDLSNVGFKLNIQKHNLNFDKNVSYRYGVNEKEDLIMVTKI